MRDKIVSDTQLAPYCIEGGRTVFSAMLELYESWLYEEGFDATKSMYTKKLEELKKVGNPIYNRQYEARSRPNAMLALQKTIKKYTLWLNTSPGDKNYAHITMEVEELATCSDKVDKASAWMYHMLDRQGGLAANVDPVITAEQIYGKNKDLNNAVSPIMHKPIPKPKIEEKKAEEKKEEQPRRRKAVSVVRPNPWTRLNR